MHERFAMSSKRIFSWSKRQSNSEAYYRTGGLLPIDAHGTKTKSDAGVQRPSSLHPVSTNDTRFSLSPTFAHHDVAWDGAASDLQAAFNDILRSPMLEAASIQKPLPNRPRSVSLPTSPELPAELPGSLLLANQGYPVDFTPQEPWRTARTTHINSSDTCVDDCGADQKIQLEHLSLIPEPLTHTKSVPNLGVQHSPMKHVQSWATLDSAITSASNPLNAQHRRIRSETSRRRSSRSDLGLSPSKRERSFGQAAPANGIAAVDMTELPQPSSSNPAGDVWNSSNEICRDRRKNALDTSATPTPTVELKQQTENPRVAILEQDPNTSNLHAQSDRRPNELPAGNLLDRQRAAVTTLPSRARVLEEQQKPYVQLPSSDNLLFLVETTESPQTPVRESVHDTASTTSSSSTPSYRSTQEKQWSPQHLRNSPEMENLKRKLSSTRRPEATNRNLLPELNQYKQNNVALQKQIESLMAKLNESRKRERESREACEQADQKRVAWEDKAVKATGLAKSTKALQNTIDHLESRLEIANTERLDAEEQLCNMRADRSPFDTILTKLGNPPATGDKRDMTSEDPHVSLSTVFSNASPSSTDHEAREPSTLSAFVTQIERLQDQVKQRDKHILELGKNADESRLEYERLQAEHKDLTLRSDIQADLLQKSRQSDTYLEQLRTAVFDREAVLAEKEKSLRATEKQLDSHKLLLQAEIRRHATVKLNCGKADESLPPLTSLAKQDDIDRWISNLTRRLERNRPALEAVNNLYGPEAEISSLRHEVDFYVREIIYYKLDIRGYKSDIRKLKRITAQLSSYGSRASDLDSESSSLRPVPTPSRSRFASATPELNTSNAASPVVGGPKTVSPLSGRPTTPIPSNSELNAVFTPPDSTRRTDRLEEQRPDFGLNTAMKNAEGLIVSEASGPLRNRGADALVLGPEDSVQRSNIPTSPARAQEPFGELLVDSSLTPPTGSQAPDVPCNASVSMFTFHAPSTKPKRSNSVQHVRSATSSRMSTTVRDRSASLSETNSSKTSPGRPSRPRLGLFRFSTASAKSDSIPRRIPPINIKDIHAEHISRKGDLGVKNSFQKSALSSASESKTLPLQTQERLDRFDSATKAPPRPVAVPTDASIMRSIEDSSIEPAPPTERKLSAASNSSIPFVIGMGSPHNPAIIMPAVDYWPTPCSITRNAPLKINASVARTGVGGTMSSTTPVTSPISPTNTSKPTSPPKPTVVQSVRSIFAAPGSDATFNQESGRQRGPSTPSHSRTASGSSIRTAIRMPKLRDKDKDTSVVRKDSIGHPQPLGSPFGLERSMSVGSVGRRPSIGKPGEGDGYGIGEAI